MNRNGSVFGGFFNNEHVVKKKLKSIPNKSVSHIFFTNVCIIHIYKDLYVYSHTCLFFNFSGGWGFSTNFR